MELQSDHEDTTLKKPIWLALSDMYLDTELQDYNFRYIASKIKESPFTLEEVKQINKEEVFPVLYQNALSVAGVWSGFQEEWLLTSITKKLKSTNRFKRGINAIIFKRMKWMFDDYWLEIEIEYHKQIGSAE